VRLVSTDPHHPGVFAFGQIAIGVFAFGQSALGVVAIGQLARGVFCLGQGAIGVFAVGQGAIGLWHGTGMIAAAGQSGYGVAIHLLPRLVSDPQPELPPTTDLRALLDRSASSGWLRASVSESGAIEPEDRDARIDTTAIQTRLVKGVDRAHVKVRANVVPDVSGYRHGHARVELVAEDVITYVSRPRSYLAYGGPPSGKPGERASALAIAVRSIAWLLTAGLVCAVSFVPLAEALLPP
jgi:hypothetical protein